jgi:CRP-like cAMP-binding protein
MVSIHGVRCNLCHHRCKIKVLISYCIEDSEVMAIDADKLSDLCEKDPVVGYKLMVKIAQVYFERYKTAKRDLHEMVRTPTVITALPG